MNDQNRLLIGAAGTLATFMADRFHSIVGWLADHAPTLAGVSTALFMLSSVAEKFGVFDRFRTKK